MLLVAPSTLTLDEEDDPGSFTVALNRAPGGSFTAALVSSDPDAATISAMTLGFDDSNFDAPQSVDVIPVEDDNERNETLTVIISGPGVADAVVAVTIIDQDD